MFTYIIARPPIANLYCDVKNWFKFAVKTKKSSFRKLPYLLTLSTVSKSSGKFVAVMNKLTIRKMSSDAIGYLFEVKKIIMTMADITAKWYAYWKVMEFQIET